MSKTIAVRAELLTPDAFAPFGEVIRVPSFRPDQDFESYRYWDKILKFDLSGDPVEAGYLRVMHRPFRLTTLERHRKATQTFSPIGAATGIIVVAPGDPSRDDDHPDLSRIRAFIVDASSGYHLYRGVWHQSVFPLGEYADYFMVVRRDTIKDDQEIRSIGCEVVIVL